jgi:DNA invertase Pin-like site-specific DNA recombinase
LGRFLALVDAGKVTPGSVLIVESIDRLSREDVMTALPRFVDLLNKGIDVVTLGSNPQRYNAQQINANPYLLFGSLIEMARANQESRIKGERVGAAWSRKKREAGTRGPITRKCPAWLAVKDKAFWVIPERAALVKRIFRETIEGMGARIIAKKLNDEKIPVFAHGQGWHESYVKKILRNRAVLGEYQPMTIKLGKRIQDGPMVPGYFPALISPDEFDRAARAIKKRTGKGGAPSQDLHLFTGMIKCAHCEASVVKVTKNKKEGWVYLVCANARRGLGCEYASWRVKTFEENFLKWVVDFDFKKDGAENKEFAALELNLERLETEAEGLGLKIGNLITSLELTGSPQIAQRIKALEAEKAEKQREAEEAKVLFLDLREKETAIDEGAEEFRGIIRREDRAKLRQELQKRVKRMLLVFHAGKVEFHDERFCRVEMINGEKYDLLESGESIHYKEGKAWKSGGLW